MCTVYPHLISVLKLSVICSLGVYVHLHHEKGMKGDKPCYIQFTVNTSQSIALVLTRGQP